MRTEIFTVLFSILFTAVLVGGAALVARRPSRGGQRTGALGTGGRAAASARDIAARLPFVRWPVRPQARAVCGHLPPCQRTNEPRLGSRAASTTYRSAASLTARAGIDAQPVRVDVESHATSGR